MLFGEVRVDIPYIGVVVVVVVKVASCAHSRFDSRKTSIFSNHKPQH